jgi:flagellar assembly protein FliH
MNLSTETTVSGVSGKKASADTAPARKFMFERSFDDAAVVHRAPERKPVFMKPEQIDALKKESHDAGFAAGQKAEREEKREEQAKRLNAVLAKVEESLASLLKNLDTLAHEQEEQTLRLTLAIAKKLLPAYTAQNGLKEIETLVGDAIRDMGREPRLVVRTSEGEFDALNEKIQVLATQRAYAGKVVILADAAVASGDCRIEWADGGVARDTPTTWNAIEQTILPSS